MAAQRSSLLPADMIESQLAIIDLLTAMFPGPGELDLPESTSQCVDQLRDWCQDPSTVPMGIPASLLLGVCLPLEDGGKTIQVNVSIPLYHDDPALDQPPPAKYTLRQPDWMSKAEVAALAATMPQDDVFTALDHVREEATRFLEAQPTEPVNLPPSQSGSGHLVRVWFYFPSLSTRKKRDDLVHHAPGYGLTGFVLAGKPGVLCLEGTSQNIDAYMSFIKTHSWGDIPSHQKKVSERFRETEGVQRVFEGMEEITDSLGERSGQRANRGDMQALEAWLQARGLQHAFEQVIF